MFIRVVFLCIAGLLVYVLHSNPKVAMIGLAVFTASLAVILTHSGAYIGAGTGGHYR